jgi:hypothetical protein
MKVVGYKRHKDNKDFILVKSLLEKLGVPVPIEVTEGVLEETVDLTWTAEYPTSSVSTCSYYRSITITVPEGVDKIKVIYG